MDKSCKSNNARRYKLNVLVLRQVGNIHMILVAERRSLQKLILDALEYDGSLTLLG